MLYVARHGQTTWNVARKVCGITDAELTETGREQAAALAEKAAGKKLELILTSPLCRAVETGRIVAKKCGVPIRTEPRLIEQNYGIFEGADMTDPDFLENKRNFAFRYPGGESHMLTAHRVYGLLDELKAEYGQKNILLVCHGGVCRVIRSYFTDMTNDEFFHYRPDNAAMEEYEW